MNIGILNFNVIETQIMTLMTNKLEYCRIDPTILKMKIYIIYHGRLRTKCF
jgi:hypothetical protein